MSFFFSSRRRHTRCSRDWSSDVCSSDLSAVDVVNATLPRYEQIKYFDLLEEDFTPETGELTVTLKLKRRAIEDRHRQRLDARSEERRVGEEGRFGGLAVEYKKE